VVRSAVTFLEAWEFPLSFSWCFLHYSTFCRFVQGIEKVELSQNSKENI